MPASEGDTGGLRQTNPVVEKILSGTAPRPAMVMAAQGLLPLAPAELIEVLVALRSNEDPEISGSAEKTLSSQDEESLTGIASAADTSPAILSYFASRPASAKLHQATVLNHQTPGEAIATLASATVDGSLLELISINQQRLIRNPDIIEAVLSNPARTPEAERRMRETRREFFEKERGAQQVAAELRAQGLSAAAEFIESADSIGENQALSLDDAWLLAQHIEVSDADIDDSWLPSELLVDLYEEPLEQRLANADRVMREAFSDIDELAPERVSLLRRIMLMSVKDRIRLGMKGDREARTMLIRDANKVVSSAVINNPRITDREVENIAAMRTVSDDVLRLISLNRGWARSYPIVHNLARNPRSPIPTAVGILSRLHTKDLKAITQNRNVSEAVRRHAQRLVMSRSGQ